MVARVSGTGRVVTASQIRDNSIAKQTMLLRSSLVEKIVECAGQGDVSSDTNSYKKGARLALRLRQGMRMG
jgi:hypothetical protein